MSFRQKLKLLKQSNLDFLTGLYTHSGNLCQIKAGLQNIIIINHPDYAKHVLQTNSDNYPKDNFYQLAEQIIGQNILTTNDMDFWTKHRKIMAGLFQPQSVQGMGKDIIDEVEQFIHNIQKNKALCLNEMATKLTLHVISRLLFSMAISEEQIQQLAELLNYFSNLLIKKRQPFSLPIIPWLNPSFRHSHSEFKQLIQTIIQANDNNNKDDLLNRLTSYRCPVTSKALTNDELFSESALMLFAGHETTANALTWLFITLSKYPGIRRNLQNEIHQVLHNKPLEVDDLEKMPLLQSVVMEVLRLFPSFPAVPRYSLKDDEIDGYHIPAKSMIVINIAMIQRHPEFWSNPEGFMPERFINDKPQNKYAYLPFINQHRVCIGKNLAFLELQIITAMLLQKFTFDLLPGEDISSNYVISLRTKKDVYVQVRTAKTLIPVIANRR